MTGGLSVRRILTTSAFLLGGLWVGLGAASGLAQQQPDPKYIGALGTVYAGAQVGKLIKEWCDERVPTLKASNAKGLEAWRTQMEMPMIEARLGALLNGDTSTLDTTIEGNRQAVYTQLDGASKDPEMDCKDLEKTLKEQFNLKSLYAKEYAYIATIPFNPKGATGGSSTGSGTGSSTGSGTGSSTGAGTGSSTGSGTGSSTGSTTATAGSSTPATKLPVMPPFDYATFAKLKLDPEKEPIPDEYHCYPQVSGDRYATSELTLQILPGRKYRIGFGGSTGEGTFRMDRSDLYFTSGVLESGPREYFGTPQNHYYRFGRREGAQIWIYKIGTGAKKLDFRCHQRGGNEQIALLRFKRKDPQVGAYPCILTDGTGADAGALEVLAGGRYRFRGNEGTYRADVTGDLGSDSSNVDFLGGGLNNQLGFYSEDEAGQAQFRFFSSPKFECTRQGAARPDPKFGPAKAPAAPGTGGSGSPGLEGRYFYGRQQFVDYNNNLPCQGICYGYRFFQKDGYVYSDDAGDTEGLTDTDCGKTYPSGFPVCQTYTLKGESLQIGNGKPVRLVRGKTGLVIGQDELTTLEPLDGLTFNLAYGSQRISGGVGSSAGGSSKVNLSLRGDGRFSREASGSSFVDTATVSGTFFSGSAGSAQAGRNGSYRVYGNTFEFKYDDGRVVKQFAFLPKGRKDLTFLHVGGSIYLEEKKK